MELVQQAAYGAVVKSCDAARALDVSPGALVLWRTLCAQCTLEATAFYMAKTSADYIMVAPLISSSSLAADATQERLTLPIVGFTDCPQVTTSSYHVFVSMQEFAWVLAGDDDEERQWHKHLPERPVVPIIGGESGEVLHSAAYLVDQVKAYTAHEASGVQRARMSSLHWDLDGHPANLRMAALRRDAVIRETGRTPCCSVRHCGNHCQNLIDNCVMDAAEGEDDPMSTMDFMITGSAFFRMGGNFLRFVQAVALVINTLMLPTVVGAPPPNAAAVAEELRYYCVSNYKTFVQCPTETWDDSSGSDDDDEAQGGAGGHGGQGGEAAEKVASQTACVQAFVGRSPLNVQWLRLESRRGHWTPLCRDGRALRGLKATRHPRSVRGGPQGSS